jgi:uncharacterized membrane protein (DUF373 family)
MLGNPRFMDGATAHFERVAIVLMQIALMIVLALAIYEIGVLLYRVIAAQLVGAAGAPQVETVSDLQKAVQRAFAGVLLIILGLELLETLRTYFVEHRVRLEVILIVAIIAVGRHIIQLDLEHIPGLTLVGIGVLILALTGGYFLIRKSGVLTRSGEAINKASSQEKPS